MQISRAGCAYPAPAQGVPAPRSPPRAGQWRFDVGWAASEDDVRDAQCLRYRVFAQEMGARLVPPRGTPPGLDVDRFDAFCDHLLVRVVDDLADERGVLVGTYRVLAPAAAESAGGFYTDTEFDLTPLAKLRPRAVELGRSCVHGEWRSGGVVMAMWTALGQYMMQRDLDTMIGCASIAHNDGGVSALHLWNRLRLSHLADPQWQVQPHAALPIGMENHGGEVGTEPGRLGDAPPLIKGYLRCGARVLGPPALDTAFNTADLPLMMRIDDLAPRYRKHFLGDSS